VLERHGLDPSRVAALVQGEGELDVDRMDYLVRDAHHTGVPYGSIDHSRLVNELRVQNGNLVLREGNVATAESLLVARYLMNTIVYRHHVSRIAGAMLERACEQYPETTGTSVESFRRMADHDLLVELRESVPNLGRRIEYRDLYKRAVWAPLSDVPRGTVDANHSEERAAELLGTCLRNSGWRTVSMASGCLLSGSCRCRQGRTRRPHDILMGDRSQKSCSTCARVSASVPELSTTAWSRSIGSNAARSWR